MAQQKQKVWSNSLNTFVVRSLSTKKREQLDTNSYFPTFLIFVSYLS